MSIMHKLTENIKYTLFIPTKIPFHVSLDTSTELEFAIKQSLNSHLRVNNFSLNLFMVKLTTIMLKLGLIELISELIQKFNNRHQEIALLVLMGVSYQNLLPMSLFKGRKYLFIFDAWEQSHKEIVKIVKQFGISGVFVSSKTSASMLSTYKCKSRFYWIPEGINIELYKYRTFNEKSIDVLELGRRYDSYHNEIAETLKKYGFIHKYEIRKAEIVFPSRASFIDGLANTKISICFPSSLTHPERSGSIETMTVRYLQSMASKCLVVGRAPLEMIELFGYNPIVEVDMDKPAEQLIEILRNYEDYIPFIEKNYSNLVNHSWRNRWDMMESIITNSK